MPVRLLPRQVVREGLEGGRQDEAAALGRAPQGDLEGRREARREEVRGEARQVGELLRGAAGREDHVVPGRGPREGGACAARRGGAQGEAGLRGRRSSRSRSRSQHGRAGGAHKALELRPPRRCTCCAGAAAPPPPLSVLGTVGSGGVQTARGGGAAEEGEQDARAAAVKDEGHGAPLGPVQERVQRQRHVLRGGGRGGGARCLIWSTQPEPAVVLAPPRAGGAPPCSPC